MSALNRAVAVLTVLIILIVPSTQIGAADQPEYVIPVIFSMTVHALQSGIRPDSVQTTRRIAMTLIA